MGKFKFYQEQIQEVVEKGINVVEEQQKKLVVKFFDYVEKLEFEVCEYSVKSLCKCYNGYSDSLFDQLCSLNSCFGNFVVELVVKLEKDVEKVVVEIVDEVISVVQSVKVFVVIKKLVVCKILVCKSIVFVKKIIVFV